MQVAGFAQSLLIFYYRHHSGLSKCSLTLQPPLQTMENQNLALNTMFCLHLQLTGNTCLWDKRRSLISKVVNLKANLLAKKIGNGVSMTCSEAQSPRPPERLSHYKLDGNQLHGGLETQSSGHFVPDVGIWMGDRVVSRSQP